MSFHISYKLRVIALIFVAFCSVYTVSAQKSTGIKKEQRRNQQQITQAQRNVKQNAIAVENNLRSLELLEGEIGDISKDVRRLRTTSDSIYGLIRPLNDTIKALDRDLKVMSEKYAEALRKSQTNGRSLNDLSFVLSSDNFRQAWQRYRSLKQFSRWRQRKSGEIAESRARVAERKERLDSLRSMNSKVLKKVESQKNTLEKKRVETERLVKSLKTQSKQLDQILKKRQQEAARLEERLEKAIAEEIQQQQERERRERERLEKERLEKERLEKERVEKERLEKENQDKAKQNDGAKSGDSGKKTSTSKKTSEKQPTTPKSHETNGGDNTGTQIQEKAPDTKTQPATPTVKERFEALTGSFESNRGKLPFPVKGNSTIVKKFGRQKHPRLPKVETNNPGIDIEASKGATVHAVFDGEVSQIFKLAGYNNVIVLRHGDYVTVYANIATLDVKKGDHVKTGQQLGKLYVDHADGDRSILHFELRREKEKKDPEMWLRR